MRVALCISGQIRPAWRHCHAVNQQNLLDVLHPDVFLSAWADDAEMYLEFREVCRAYDCRLTDAEIHHVAWVNLQHRCLVEKLPDVLTERTSYWPQFHSWHKANNLKAMYEKVHGFKYDLVIRNRPDVSVDVPLTEKNLAVAQHGDLVVRMFEPEDSMPYLGYRGACDLFFLGSSAVMDRVADTIFAVPQAMRQLKDRTEVILPNEAIFCEALRILGVKYRGFPDKPNLSLVR